MNITEICAYLRNYFTEDADKHIGEFEISGGVLSPLDFLKNGQYFRIVGSSLNDGVYQYSSGVAVEGLKDETFKGAVWAMNVPPSFVALCDEIKIYSESAEAKPSVFSSETLGAYSYTKFSDEKGRPCNDWRDVFRRKLNQWRAL